MDMETELDSCEHYLPCNCVFSDKMIERIKADVTSFMTDRKKDDNISSLLTGENKKINCSPDNVCI